jgi:UDP-N-acetylmuramate--alanine ligase
VWPSDASSSAERGSSGTDVSPVRSVFFVGIGGVGLAPLATLAVKNGWRVSGSDAERNDRTERLACLGCRVCVGHHGSNLGKEGAESEELRLPDVVVASSAVPSSNPELVAAREAGVPVLSRRQWLQEVTSTYNLLAVAGTHGKTTTSAMAAIGLSHLTHGAVTAVVGGSVPQFPDGTGFMEPSSPDVAIDHRWFVCEADEYDRTFLGLSPHIAIVTNIEYEHVDCYKDAADVQAAFMQFVAQLRPGGLLLLCGEDAGAMRLREVAHDKLAETGCETETYGFSPSCDWCIALQDSVMSSSQDFRLLYHGQPVGDISLQLPGRHNALNAAAAIAAAVHAHRLSHSSADGQPIDFRGFPARCVQAALALSGFEGVRRRFQVIGRWTSPSGMQVDVVDDYAHHPTEIRATLSATRQLYSSCFPGSNLHILAVFQPHTTSRLAAFAGDFCEALMGADEVIVLDTYAARLQNEGCSLDIVTSDEVVRQLTALCPNKPYRHVPGSMQVCAGSVASAAMAKDETVGNGLSSKSASLVVVVLMGAGDVTDIGPRLLSTLEACS